MDQDMSTPTPPEEPEMADLDTGQPGDSSSESFFLSEDAIMTTST